MNADGANLRAEVARLVHAQVSTTVIAETLGVSRQTVWRCRRDLGIVTYGHGRTPGATGIARAAQTKVQLAKHPEILALVLEGHSAAVISRRVGVSIRTVSRVRVEAGLGVPKRRATEEDKLRAKTLLHEGASYAEVSRTIGFDAQAIKRWFPGYDWTVRQRDEYAAMQRRMAALTWQHGVRCDKKKRPWEYI